MMRRSTIAGVIGLLVVSAAPAQTLLPLRFHWQTGQVLVYRVDQNTMAAEVVEGNKAESTTRLTLVKRWQVLDVDAAGVATLQRSLSSLRIETTTPKGEVRLFDSDNLDKSEPQLRQELIKYIGVPLVVLRIDGRGQVVEVKECKYAPASRFECEPPFVLHLPDAATGVGQGWQRTYNITLEPGQGIGEKFLAVQNYLCKGLVDGAATIGLTTELKAQPEALADRAPLLQVQPEGEVVFDVTNGLLRTARLQIDKELTNHRGAGSSYKFKSTYTEQHIGNK